MPYNYTEQKIIGIVSDKLPIGLALNAIGDLGFSAGRYANQEMMGQAVITDADGNSHKGITKYPLIILKAAEAEIKSIIHKARMEHIEHSDFTQEMFDTGPDEELVAALQQTKEPSIRYHAVLLVGETVKLKALTSHLKLYR